MVIFKKSEMVGFPSRQKLVDLTENDPNFSGDYSGLGRNLKCFPLKNLWRFYCKSFTLCVIQTTVSKHSRVKLSHSTDFLTHFSPGGFSNHFYDH